MNSAAVSNVTKSAEGVVVEVANTTVVENNFDIPVDAMSNVKHAEDSNAPTTDVINNNFTEAIGLS